MIHSVLTLLGPIVVRLLSDQMVQRLAMSAAHVALDAAQSRLLVTGHRQAAELLQEVESDLFKDPTPLADAAIESAKTGVIVKS